MTDVIRRDGINELVNYLSHKVVKRNKDKTVDWA